MPFLMALVIVPFDISMLFFVASMTLYASLAFAEEFSENYVSFGFLATSPFIIVGFIYFSRWFRGQISGRLIKYANSMQRAGQRGGGDRTFR